MTALGVMPWPSSAEMSRTRAPCDQRRRRYRVRALFHGDTRRRFATPGRTKDFRNITGPCCLKSHLTTICHHLSIAKSRRIGSIVVAMGTTRGERLRIAREKHFKSARRAGKAMGIPVSTYGAHERAEAPGGRDYGPDEAKKYGRRFKVAPEWLLPGREPFPGAGAEEAPPAP